MDMVGVVIFFVVFCYHHGSLGMLNSDQHLFMGPCTFALHGVGESSSIRVVPNSRQLPSAHLSQHYLITYLSIQYRN